MSTFNDDELDEIEANIRMFDERFGNPSKYDLMEFNVPNLEIQNKNLRTEINKLKIDILNLKSALQAMLKPENRNNEFKRELCQLLL